MRLLTYQYAHGRSVSWMNRQLIDAVSLVPRSPGVYRRQVMRILAFDKKHDYLR
jgi:hypothetical protein